MKNARTQLRDWLNAEGRKVTWLAAQVPAHPSSVSCWLTGARKPDRIRRERLAALTGLNIAEKDCWQ